MMTLCMMEKMSTSKEKYITPATEVIEMTSKPIMQFTSGWNVDGNHQGNVGEDGDLECGEND